MLIVMVSLLWLLSVTCALYIWAKNFDEIQYIALFCAIIGGPVTLLVWGMMFLNGRNHVVWRRKK